MAGDFSSLYPSSLSQTIMNKLWLGFDLTAAIAAPILHVNGHGHVEYEPSFSQVRLSSEPPPQPPKSMLLRALWEGLSFCVSQARRCSPLGAFGC